MNSSGLLKAIADKESPLVIFVDDLQWADASSLNLFKIIAENRDIAYCCSQADTAKMKLMKTIRSQKKLMS